MLKKLTNKKGFTLMEMLIVVAIIAILVAIAIPTFNSKLNEAKLATDRANIRSGYAAVQIEVLTNDSADGTYYLKADGTVEKKDSAPDKAYKCAGTLGSADAGSVGGQTITATSWTKDSVVSYTVNNGELTTITVNTSTTGG